MGVSDLHDGCHHRTNIIRLRFYWPPKYDWRLSPQMLEERDGFTKLKETIEKTSERCQSPVVIVAHSMGNRSSSSPGLRFAVFFVLTGAIVCDLIVRCRVFQYFLHTVVETEGDIGRQWIDKHVHSYVAVGAPFLGSPKVVRSLVRCPPPPPL